ncbi:general transcription factor IIE subunit 2-like protein, partial [Tanacetum coccineum]
NVKRKFHPAHDQSLDVLKPKHACLEFHSSQGDSNSFSEDADSVMSVSINDQYSTNDEISSSEGASSNNTSDYTMKQLEQDELLEVLFCSDGVVVPNSFVLSSGRWNIIQDATELSEHGTEKLTIEKELEQYFSMLMLYIESRKSFTAEQINEASYVDVKGNKEFEFLAKNPKSMHNFGGKTQLSVKGHVDDIDVTDLKDAYPTVMQDLQLPRGMLDVERELRKIGMKPATNMAKRNKMAEKCHILSKTKPKEKKKVICKRAKLTNSHLEDLLRAL